MACNNEHVLTHLLDLVNRKLRPTNTQIEIQLKSIDFVSTFRMNGNRISFFSPLFTILMKCLSYQISDINVEFGKYFILNSKRSQHKKIPTGSKVPGIV